MGIIRVVDHHHEYILKNMEGIKFSAGKKISS